MTTLPSNFQFSQGSLQDYADCPRRFQLRYMLQLAWPAQEVEPALENEQYMRQGTAFHRLIHRHMLGIPTENLSRSVQDADLRRWWHNYLEHRPVGLPDARFPEIVLSTPMGAPSDDGHRLLAKYDLVAVDAGRRAIIVDWKTSRKRTKHKYLVERLQTKVYPYLLVQAGAHLNDGQPLAPEQVEMVYWFADYPEDPEHFGYDTAQCEADEVYLTSLIEKIVGLGDADFPLTMQERRCKFCPYRSLCQRGERAGTFDEVLEALDGEIDTGDTLDIDIDFEQIAEIEY